MPLALLEHVNLNIVDREAARAFGVEGLGCVVNEPSTSDRQLHLNLGASQLHLPTKLCHADDDGGVQPVRVAQRWPGHIELWCREPLAAPEARLRALGRSPSLPDPHTLEVTCPHGTRYWLRRAPPSFEPSGAHPSGSGTLVGMPRVVHSVRPGAAAPLRAFWQRVLGAESELAPRAGGCAPACVVHFRTGQELVFEEAADAPMADAYDHDEAASVHLCVYVDGAAAFRRAFDACEAEQLLYANPRFAASPPWFGNAIEWREVEACGQFRIKDLARDAAGVPALVLELEVRSPSHRSCPLSRGHGAGAGPPSASCPVEAAASGKGEAESPAGVSSTLTGRRRQREDACKAVGKAVIN
jgi:hypothetical protein